MKNKSLLALFVGLPFMANAHHSTDANFTQEIISVDGIIEQVRSMNPHASVLIKAASDTDGESYWLAETVGRTTLDRQGISIDQLEIGAKVTATGRKGRREFTLYLQKIFFEDGSELTLQSGPN